MSLIKIVTILNWVIIVVLGFMLLLEFLSPSRGGGDAAGKGIGQAIITLLLILFVVLIILNVLPYAWPKYLGLFLVAFPFLYFALWPKWQEMQRKRAQEIEAARPIYDDPDMERCARLIKNRDVDSLKKQLAEPAMTPEKKDDLLTFAIAEARNNYEPEVEIACVRALFDAGAKLPTHPDSQVHIQVAYSGNVDLLRFLLEKGADANANLPALERSILFEAIDAHQEPEATVRLLLEHGAKTDATGIYDPEEGPISPLLRAAILGRWGVCLALLEHGADINFTSSTGRSFKSILEEAGKDFSSNGYSTQEDFDRLNKYLKK
jgi:ankyrin repeat protein